MVHSALPLLALCLSAAAALGVPGPGPNSQQPQQAVLGNLQQPVEAHGRPHHIPSPFPHTPASTVERYDGHEVWRINWRALSSTARDELMLAFDMLSLDIWRASGATVDVRVPPQLAKAVRAVIPSAAVIEPFISNVQDLVDVARPHKSHSRRLTDPEDPEPPKVDWNVSSIDSPFHDGYHVLDEVYEFGDQLQAFFGDVLKPLDIGKTAEGRTIRGWTAHAHDPEVEVVGGPEVEFVVTAGQHAREWVGSSSAMYFLHELLVANKNDPDSRAAKFLKTFTFTVVPVLNPDGFEYSHDQSRLWKKNRQDVGGLLCKGIDLNGNWGYEFRPSRLACTDTYSGQTAFEALETRAMARYLINGTSDAEPRHAKVRAFVDLHSYGQMFMFPFSYSCDDFPPDAENLMEAGLGVARAMRVSHGGESYQCGQACDMTYRSPGEAIDYSYGVGDVRWSYSAELRDTGTYGFLLPPHLIRPTGNEVFSGLMYLAFFIWDTEIDI